MEPGRFGRASGSTRVFCPEMEDWPLFTVANNNHDDYTWGIVDETKTNHRLVFSSQTALRDYGDSSRPYDDWLFLPAINFPNADALYEFKLKAARGTFSAYYGKDEVFEVKAGLAPNAAAMTVPVMGQTHVGIENNRDGKLIPFEQIFGVPSAGVYYIGIHSISSDSSSLGFYVADISLEMQETTVSAPEAVASLSATRAPGCQLSASVVFHMPTKDIAGNNLPADTEIRAVATSSVDTQETVGSPGQVCVIPGIATEQGINMISVATFIGDNGGRTATTEVYTGVSVPGPITNTRCIASEDNMTLRFEWDPAIQAVDGTDEVLPTGNTYIIYEELMNNVMGIDTYYWNRVGELEGDQTFYEIAMPEDGIQRKMKIGVVQKNVAGVNNNLVTSIIGIGGHPYELPMIEDFRYSNDKEALYNPILEWEATPEYYGQTWTINDPAIIDQKYNIGHKSAMIFSNRIGTKTRIAIPKFSTTGLTAPTAKMIFYMGADTPDLWLYATAYGSNEWKQIGQVEIDRTKEDYGLISMDLGEEFADKPWVYLAIDGYFDPTKHQIGFLSEYTIINSLPTDLGIYSLEGESMTIGNESEYLITVYNPGTCDSTIESLNWSLNRGQTTLASGSAITASEVIESMSMKDYTVKLTPTPDMLGPAEFNVSLECSDDGDLNNNTGSLRLMVKSGAKVIVTDLSASQTDSGVYLSWSEPAANHITEGFEAETPFERQVNEIAGFTNFDGDGYQCWNFGEKDPVGGAPQAWTVWSAQQLKNSFGLIYEAGAGDKYLMVRCPGDELAIPPRADDWLISPEINGRSYISFKARPISVLYGAEDLEIMYSAGGNSPEDFQLLETMKIKPVLQSGSSSMEDKLIYTDYSSELPADARYFAVHYTSHDIFGVMLDELSYAPASTDRGISGYEIYRNGDLIATAPAGNSYFDATPGAGGTYTIRPVTDGDRGVMSNVVYVEGSSVDALSAGVMKIAGGKGEILISSDAPSRIQVFSMSGVLLTDEFGTELCIEAAPGLYVVKCGPTVRRVVVR